MGFDWHNVDELDDWLALMCYISMIMNFIYIEESFEI